MAGFMDRIVTVLITLLSALGRSAPCHCSDDWAREEDLDCQYPAGLQFYNCAASRFDSCCSVDSCGILEGICPDVARPPSSTICSSSVVATSFFTSTDCGIPVNTAQSAAVISSVTLFTGLRVRREKSSLAANLSASPQSVINVQTISLPKLANSTIIPQFTPPSVTYSLSTSPTQLVSVTMTNEAPAVISPILITELSTLSKNGMAQLPTTLLLTSTLMASISLRSASITSSDTKTYPYSTGSASRPTNAAAPKGLIEELERRVNDKIGIAIGAAGGGSLIIVLVVFLIKRYWKKYKAKKAVRGQYREDIRMHRIAANDGSEMFDKPDDNAADSSFETQNREMLAAERTNHAAAVDCMGAYRGVSPRSRQTNRPQNARRYARPSPASPQSTNLGTTAIRQGNASNEISREVDEFAVIPLFADGTTDLDARPLPREHLGYPNELELTAPSKPLPAIPSRNPSRVARQLSDGMPENLDTIEEEGHVASFMDGFSG